MADESNETELCFTAEEYQRLTEEERSAIAKVAERLSPEALDTPDDAQLQETFNILRACDGCIPEEEIGEDLLSDIRRKFACVYYAAIELAEDVLKQRGLTEHQDFAFCLDIDPSYEDTTHVAIVDMDNEKRPFCYLHGYEKAWHVSFESLRDIAHEVLRARSMILATFYRLTGRSAQCI